MWYSLIRRFLFQFEPETSHHLAMKLLNWTSPQWLIKRRFKKIPQKPTQVFGLTFPNPVGLAAGFDKNADYLIPLQGLGFGFIEVGTVTPKPQAGNPKPRLFRLPDDQALINRLGFNNLGVDHLVEQLKKKRLPGIVGANIGKNRQTPLEEAAQDYCYCLRQVYPFVDYVTVNISSPNTPELRQLQSPSYLKELLSELDHTQKELQKTQKKIPLLVKIDPDLNDIDLKKCLEVILKHQVDGIIATNTTVQHTETEKGGLSGAPLCQRSTKMVERVHDLLQGKLPIIAVGGILTPEDALEKIKAGASLVQIYTGLIYQGPALVKNIVNEV